MTLDSRAPDTTPRDGTAPLLEVRGVEFSYGPLQVLFGVDLAVTAGSRVALLGTNGAGKSTLLRVVSGLGRPSAGRVLFDGNDITRSSPAERVAVGIVQVCGGKATFPSLSVLENLQIGAYPILGQRAEVARRVQEVLELFPALAERRARAAGTLSGGEQQMMALGRALIARPRLLMIDELSLGLAPVVLQQLVAVLDAVGAQGMTMLIVEQSLNIALALADTAYFMEKGEVRYSGPTGALMERGDLVRSVFFGGPGA